MSHRLLRSHQVLNLHAGQKGWYRIKNAAGQKDSAAEVYIYGHIGWDVTAAEFLKELSAITASAIDVHVATNGGDVFDGIAILNALRTHPATVTTIVDSQALSAGSFIMQAGDVRKMMPNSTMMIHDALTGGFYAEGNAKDMREAAQEIIKFAETLDAVSDNIASVYAERAGGDAAQWRETMRAETWYTAQQAVDAGLADEVVSLPTRNAAPKVKAQMDDTGFALGDRVKVKPEMVHEEGQDTGTIAEVNPGPAYGIRFDGMDEVHHWYTGEEITAVQTTDQVTDQFNLDWAALARSVKESPRG